jgi:hypothetical protein
VVQWGVEWGVECGVEWGVENRFKIRDPFYNIMEKKILNPSAYFVISTYLSFILFSYLSVSLSLYFDATFLAVHVPAPLTAQNLCTY